jgi:hypothetical protein
MGEVYRARDTRLGRYVAIKVLPEAFAADPDRVRRFEQEAQAVAALNHPHICQIYDVAHLKAEPTSESSPSQRTPGPGEGDQWGNATSRRAVGEAQIRPAVREAARARDVPSVLFADRCRRGLDRAGDRGAPSRAVLLPARPCSRPAREPTVAGTGTTAEAAVNGAGRAPRHAPERRLRQSAGDAVTRHSECCRHSPTVRCRLCPRRERYACCRCHSEGRRE